MTSKEALENLKNDFYQRFPDDWGKELWVKIEKDLDKLEHIRSHSITEAEIARQWRKAMEEEFKDDK